MAEALLDLEQALRCKRVVTPQETSVLLKFKSEAIRDFMLGVTIGGSVTCIPPINVDSFASHLPATKRLKTFLRINITAGSAYIAGMWRFGKSRDFSLDCVLAMDGTCMQSALANIIVDKYRDNSTGMHRVSKYLYIEEVYGGSRPDRPKLRWHPRNAFIANVDRDENKNETHQDGPQRNPDIKQLDPGSAQTQRQIAAVKVDPGLKTIAEADPLDNVFGYSSEEDWTSTTSSNTLVSNNRSHKRAQRRRRIHRRQEASLEARDAKPLSISE